MPKKKGVWTVCQFDGGLCEKKAGDVFEGGGFRQFVNLMGGLYKKEGDDVFEGGG